MIDVRTAPYAATTLRVALGLLFLAHAGAKLFVFTPAGTAQYFGSLGLPPALAYVTIAWEVIGGVALILGVYSRAVALAMIPLLLGTIYAVHGSAGFFFTNPKGGWESRSVDRRSGRGGAHWRWCVCAPPNSICVEPSDRPKVITGTLISSRAERG